MLWAWVDGLKDPIVHAVCDTEPVEQ